MPRRGLVLLGGLLLLLAGCTRSQGAVQPPVLPSPSRPAVLSASPTPPRAFLPLVMRFDPPTATPTPTATLTPTLTPSPTATPTPLPVTLNFCAALPQGGLPIPDGDFDGLQSALSVDYAGTLLDVNVRLEIAHTWVGDLRAALSHARQDVLLMERPGAAQNPPSGCPGNDVRVVLDDAAPAAVQDSCSETSPALNGTLRPAEPLASFAGLPADGEYLLTVSDLSRPDEGTLTAWCLALTILR